MSYILLKIFVDQGAVFLLTPYQPKPRVWSPCDGIVAYVAVNKHPALVQLFDFFFHLIIALGILELTHTFFGYPVIVRHYVGTFKVCRAVP